MNKRIISLCLALVLLLCLLPAAPTVAAAGDVAINETNFPDANFRRYVSEKLDQNGDGVLNQAEISDVTVIRCFVCGIASLKGIEYFTALETLACSGNQLTSLDVSKNTALEVLWCDNNQLSALDVSKNTALIDLVCFGNQLTSLDVSRNTALEYLDCSDNQLTSLDVSKNTALTELYCSGNQLTSLDVSKNQRLSSLACYGNKLAVLDVSAVPILLDALENGVKTVNKAEGFVEFESEQGHIRMDLGQKTIPVTNCFSDVGSDDFFYDAVLWAFNHDPQITAGTSKTKFSPYKTCTREQVVTFLWRAMGCEEPKNTQNPFKDVPADAYYTKAVLWAVEQGITTGKSKTKFGVGSPCTREQVVTFLWRAEGKPEPESTVNPFTDVSEESYAHKAILWAVEKGITKGTSKTKFSPAKTCTRGQVVTFLYRDVVGEQ
ncbi:MAG: S-layer homology domain-containing protein [Oscillospiraceae bacterium]|nr:S-layer homology domain-containing protein [Oscillospiraceae bacterium]